MQKVFNQDNKNVILILDAITFTRDYYLKEDIKNQPDDKPLFEFELF